MKQGTKNDLEDTSWNDVRQAHQATKKQGVDYSDVRQKKYDDFDTMLNDKGTTSTNQPKQFDFFQYQ